MVKQITFKQLLVGLEKLADELRDTRSLLLDFRKKKSESQQAYYSAIQGIPFSPASIGRFDPRRGQTIGPNTRFGFATGATRRASVSSFSISAAGGQGISTLQMNTDAPRYAKYFDLTLMRKGIPEFTGGLINFTRQDEQMLNDMAGDFVVKAAEKSL